VLTIFSTCKPFDGHSAVIQENAIRSWTLLSPRPEIILFGDEPGVAEVSEALGLLQVPDVRRGDSRSPLVSDMFERAQAMASYDTLCMVNADILLPQRLMDAVQLERGSSERSLLVGRRVDLDVGDLIDFDDPHWWDSVDRAASVKGKQRGDLCIDWFVFPRWLYREVPDFAIGRTRYDNWLIWQASAAGAVVVDCSDFVQVVHQNHDYARTGGSINTWEGPEARRAEELLGHWSHYHSIAHARLLIDATGAIRPARGLRYRAARPRRVAAQAVRFTRPWRRRIALARAGRAGRRDLT
jgi:hypothetical protein